MDATTDQIKREIEQARERISETTSQIGEKIRATFDWRQQVAEHPLAAAGLAAGAGLVLGAAVARGFRGERRMAGSYGEQYTYDRIARDVEAQSPASEAAGSEWLRGQTGGATGTSEEAWRAPHDSAWSRQATGGRRWGASRESSGGMNRSGAIAGLVASIGAALEPQLKEIGRTLAEQLKDLSNHFIGQGKEAMKSRVDRWREGSSQRRARGESGGTSGWQTSAAGGSTLSSESTGAWSPSSPGTQDTRGTRAPESRESASAERRMGEVP